MEEIKLRELLRDIATMAVEIEVQPTEKDIDGFLHMNDMLYQVIISSTIKIQNSEGKEKEYKLTEILYRKEFLESLLEDLEGLDTAYAKNSYLKIHKEHQELKSIIDIFKASYTFSVEKKDAEHS